MTCVLLLAGQVRAVMRTWTGGGPNDNWSSAGNWSPSGAPSAGDALVFAGSTRLTPYNDLAAGTPFLTITFNSGAGNFSLNGNALVLSGGSGAIVSNASSGQMTLYMDITISANTTITVSAGGTVLMLGIFDNALWPFSANGSGTVQFGGPITGGGPLTMTGSNGVLKLSGANGSFTGPITVSAGTLVVDHPNGLGAATQGTTVAAGAVLDLNGIACATAEPLTLHGTGIASTGALVNNAAGGAVFPGPITLGSASLISAGNGSLALSGTAPVAGNYPLTLGGTGSGSLAAGLGSGIGGLTKTGAGTWSMLGTGSASAGGTTVSGGTLDLGNPGCIGSGGITLNGGNLSFHDNGPGNNSLIDYSRGLTLANGANATIIVANAGTNTGNSIRLGPISCGNATLNVAGANGYRLETGPLTLNGSPSGSVFLNPTTADLVLGSVTGGAYPYTLDLGGTAAGGRINGVISDGAASVSIAKGGTSVWMLAGTNAYTGTTAINGGALIVTSNTALGSTTGGTTVAAGAMLDLAGTNYSAAEPLILNGTGISGSGAMANSNAAAAAFAGPLTLGSAASIVGETGAINLTHVGSLGGPYTLTLGGSQGGSFSANPSGGSLAKTGSGTWTRSGSSGLALNSLSLSQGTLALGTGMTHTLSGSLSITGGVLDFGSSTLQVSASSVDLSGLNGLTAGTGILEFNSISAQAFLPATIGKPKVRKTGGGTLTVNGSLDAGQLVVTAGTWDWGSGTLTHSVDGIATSGSSYMNFGNNTVNVRENACDLSGLAGLNSGSGQLKLYSTGSQAFTPLSGAGHPMVVKLGSGATNLIGADLTAAGLQVQAGTLDLGNRTVTVNGNLDVGGGTLEAVGAGLTVTGNLALSAGHLGMPGGFLYVGGNVSRTGGTAAHNNGWLTLNGPSPGKAFDFSPTLYNLNVSASGGGWIAANNGFTVANLFQVQNGAFSLGAGLNHAAADFNSMAGSLDFGSSKLAITGSTAYFAGLGSITTGTGTLEFSGSGAQAFYPIVGYTFPTVKRSGTGTATITSNPLFANSLVLAGGTLNLGSGFTTTVGGLTITGGNLHFGSGTLKLTGATADFTSLATLDPGTGTLEFAGASPQAFVPKSSLTFPGLTQSGNGGTTVATQGFASNGPLLLSNGNFDLGVSLSHSVASIGVTAGGLLFNNSTLSVTSGDANLTGLSTLSPGTGTLAFTAAGGTQTLTPRDGSGHPSILHTGAGTLALANYDLACLSFSQTAGGLDLGGSDITTTAGGNFSIANGTSSTLANLAGRTLAIAGNASFAGTSAANRLNLDPNATWFLAVSGSLTASLASLGNSSTSGSAGACGNCADLGGNSTWSYSVHWVGGGGTPNWTLAANWGSGSVPAGGEDVIFDSGAQDALLDTNTAVKSLVMAGGYTGSFDFGSHTLSITANADFSTGGTIIPGTGTLAFTGTGAQAFIPKSGATFPAILQNGNAGTTTVTGQPLSAGNLTLGLGTFHLGASLTHTVGAVSGTGSLDFGTANLNATGNVNLASAAVTASASNTLAFTGNTAQTFTPNASVTGLKLTQNGFGTAVAGYDFATPVLTIVAGGLDLGTSRNHSAASISIAGGGLDFKSSTLRVAGTNVDFSALDSLKAGTGTLEFNGGSPQTFTPMHLAVHPNVKQSGTGGVAVSGNDLTTGTLSVTYGVFALGAGRTTTASALSLTGGTLDFSGATLKTGAATIDLSQVALSGEASGTLEFTGNGALTFIPKNGAASPKIVQSGTGVTTLSTNALLTASILVGAGEFDLAAFPLTANGITVTGGILTATNGSIDLNGSLSVTGGRIKFPGAGAFTVGGGITIAAAAQVDHNSGTITLDGNAGGTLDIDNVIYGLIVNGSGGTWTVANHRLWAEGALSLANGTLVLGAGLANSAGSIGSSGGSLDFGTSSLRVLYSDANLGDLASLTAGAGTLEFSSALNDQILIPKDGAAHPAIAHTGTRNLQLSSHDLLCQGFSNSAGGLDLNGRDLTVNPGGTFSITNGTSTTLSNLGNRTITVYGNAGFAGTSAANRLNLNPTAGWTLAVTGSLTASLASLGNSSASGSMGACSDCYDAGGNTRWGYSVHWVGGGGTPNWTLAANWSSGSIPAGSEDLIFDSGSQNALLDTDATVKSIAISAGYTGAFYFGSRTLSVTENADFRSGGSIVRGTGALAFVGAGGHNLIPSGTDTLPAIVQNGTGTTTVGTNALACAGLILRDGALNLVAGTHGAGSVGWASPASGTLSLGTSTLRTTGNVDVSSLTLLSGSGTLEFAGGTAQIFTPKGATVSPALKQSGIGGTTVAGSGLTTPSLAMDGGAFHLGTGLTHVVTGALSLAGGTLDFGSSILQVQAANIDFSSLDGMTAGTGRLEFTGSSAQTFTPKAALAFPEVRQNGAVGTTIAGDDLHASRLVLAGGAFSLGTSHTHVLAGLATSSGSLDFSSSQLRLSAGDADFSGLSSLAAGTGALYFEAASDTQSLSSHPSDALPPVFHGAGGVLRLGNLLRANGLDLSAGSLDMNGRDIDLVGAGNLNVSNGSPTTFAGLAGRTITLTGSANLAGATGSWLGLDPASTWFLAVSGALDAEYAHLANCNASASAITGTAVNSVDLGGNSNWNFAISWTGAGNDFKWSTPANWSSGSIPGPTVDVVFDATSSDNALLDADGSAKSITLAGGYAGSFDFGSHTLTVFGNADFRGGAGIVPGTGALAFAGSGAHAFYPKSGQVFPDLIVVGGGTATVNGAGLSAGNLTVTSGTFNLGSGTRAVKGISGSGTLDFGSSDLDATGDADLSALTVAAAGRTLNFKGSAPQIYKPNAALTGLSMAQAGAGGTTVIANGFTVPALSLSAGAVLHLGNGLVHTVANTLSLGNGTLDFGSATLRVASAAADFSVLSSLTPGTGALHFTGSSSQSFTPKSGANFPALVQNGSVGTTVTGNPLQADTLKVQAGVFGFGSLNHTLKGIAATAGGLDFGGAIVTLTAGDADLSNLSTLSLSGGKLVFAGASGTQTLKPKEGMVHPVIEHSGAGVLRLAGTTLLCAAFRNLAGGVDLNGTNVNASGALDIFGGAGALANLGGRVLTAGGNATLRGQPGNRLGLAPGTPWTLAVSGLLKAANAEVGRNTASLSQGLADSSADLGGNANWTFLDSVPPSPVSAFQAKRVSGHAVELAWTPSPSPDADSVMIRFRADGTYPAGPADGLLWRMLPKTATLDTATGLPDKAILAFAAFARDSSGNFAAPAASARDTARMPDVTSPSNVKAFAATAFEPAAAALAWTAPDSADADSVMIRYRTDGAFPSGIADGTLLRMVSDSRTGDTATGLSANVVYHFALFARDSAGNWSPASTDSRDSSLYQEPVLGSFSISDNQGFTRDGDPALLFSASGADSLRFCLLSDTALAAWTSVRSRDSIDLGAGGDGKRILAARFKNVYGRLSAWYLDTTALDRTAPVPDLDLQPAYSWRNWPNAVGGSARDALAGTDSVFLLRKRLADGYAYNGSGWTTVTDTARFRADSLFSAPLPGAAMATGGYEFTVWAKDRVGNVSVPSVLRVDYAENRAPDTASAQVADTVYQNQPIVWSVALGDRDAGDSVLAVSVAAPAWLKWTETADTGQGGFSARRIFSFTGKAGQADVAATAVLTLQVRDLGGMTFLYSKTFTVVDVNDAPAFATGRDSITAKERNASRYVPRFGDPDPADKGVLALLAAPPWAALEDSAVVLRPGSRDVGRALVRITVSDGRLLDTLDLDVTVPNLNDAPVAFPGERWPAPAAWKEDVPDSFTVVVVDMDKNDLVELGSPLPAFLSYRDSVDGTGFNHFFRFASAPGQKDTGSYPIRLRFSDAAGAASELAFTARVSSVNDTPLAVVSALQTAAGAARVGLAAKDEDGGTASTRFHYRLIDAKGDTVRRGICPGATLALQPLADGGYTLALAAEDEGGLRQAAYTSAALTISGATSLAVDSGRWDMIAYPGRALAAASLGAGAGIATWDEASGDGSPGRYASGNAADSLFRGKGYWVKPLRRVFLSASSADLSDKPFPLKLVRGKQGWNQIGNPYPYYVDLSASGFTFWEWDPAKRDLADAKGILKPWGAYWVQTPKDSLITIPNRPWFPPAAAPLARAAVPDPRDVPYGGAAAGPESWSLQLVLSAGPYRDEANFLGVRPAVRAAGSGPQASMGIASDGTLGDAPKFGEYIALRFERPGERNADSLARGFAADFRPGLSADEEWWDFAVEDRATGMERATLALPGLPELAARGLYAFLVDRGEARALPSQAGTQIVPGLQNRQAAADPAIDLALGKSGAAAHYSLVITPHPDFAARLKGSFNISQNFPNPARDLTTFRFFLPQAWDANGMRMAKSYRLKLNIYDYRGRLAATVAEGSFAPGAHALLWRPQAEGGGPLAPGAYVYRLETPGFAKSLKLIVK